MSIFVSDQNQVVFLYESGTYASPSGTSGQWLGLVQSHEPQDNENVQSFRFTGAGNRNVGMFVESARDYAGTLTFYPQDFKMLGFTLGSVLDSSGAITRHAISELNSDGRYAFTSGATTYQNFPSFTIKDSKKGLADGTHQVRTYNGCVVDSYTITASEGNPVTVEVSYVAQSLTLGSKTTDIVNIANKDNTRPYMWSDVTFELPDGTSMDTVKEISLAINNNLRPRHYVNGSRVVQAIIPTNREYEVSVTTDADTVWAKTLYEQYWQGGSTFNTALNFIINSGSEYHTIIMSGCKMTAMTSAIPNEDVNEFNFTFKPQTISSAGSDLVIPYNPY